MTFDDTPTRRTLRLTLDGQPVAVRYRPNDITLEDYDDAELHPWETAVRLIVSCVATWSILWPSGGVYPVTRGCVRLLPEKFVYDLATAIAEDLKIVLLERAQEAA